MYPEEECWPALYTGLTQAIVLAEKTRHSAAVDELANIRISELRISLECVLDACLDDEGLRTRFGVGIDAALCHPSDYTLTHVIVRESRSQAEALRIPSCTRFPGGILVMFTDRLRPGSRIDVVSAIDPQLRPHLP